MTQPYYQLLSGTDVKGYRDDLMPVEIEEYGEFFIMGNACAKGKPVAHVSSSNFSGSKKPASKPKQYSNSSEQRSAPTTSELNVPKSISSNLKSFSLNDLKEATKNFRRENLIGEGGFGRVFKGWIDENTYGPTKPGTGIVVAIKNLKPESFQGHKEWLQEVNYLGMLQHENLVKLIGYCLEGKNRLLVYEFMQKGSLENHLFRKGVQPMAWVTRVNIAIGVARGLTFLHSLDQNVIFRDLKASNILLDSVCDIKSLVSHFVTTGLYDGPGFSEETLVDWAKPFLNDNRRVLRIMDTRLGGQYSKKGAQAAAALALQCLNTDPKFRPPMVEVLAALEALNSSNSFTRTPKHESHSTKISGGPSQK
ncbi:hypothetical protein JHK84_035973 [Glycine max]|nr:hypothetical protein JHK84_035973 [Glycine max]